MAVPDKAVLAAAGFQFVRLRSSDDGMVFQPEQRNASDYLLCIDVQTRQSTCLVARQSPCNGALRGSFDILQFHFSERWLARLQQGGEMLLPPVALRDPVVAQLAVSLLPALDDPQNASPAFVSHVAMAVGAHLLHHYGQSSDAVDWRAPSAPGTLARWQEARAKQTLKAGMADGISMAKVAAACGLSTGYFTTAFKKTTGLSPGSWLMAQRIQQASELLGDTQLSLSDIAIATGFSDQAHLTRNFSRAMGTSPGKWRRSRA